MTPNALQSFAIALKQARVTQGMTQEELAERSGVSVRSISDLERGVSRFPHKDTVQLLVDALSMTPDEAGRLFALARAPKASAGSLATTETDVPFVGREREMDTLHQMLRDPRMRLLTLTGVAGVGKTRLAVESAAQASDIFADGVTVIDLSPIQAAQFVVPAIAQALGVREQAAHSLRDGVIQSLVNRRMLLLLDNCEQVLDARADIAYLLEHCPQLMIMTTSRERLDIDGERILTVLPLATPGAQTTMDDKDLMRNPSVMLFVACAQARQHDFTLTPVLTRTIAKICDSLEGIPLAIELAAAHVAVMPPRAILTQVSGSSRRMLLGWLRHDTTRAPRQHTLRNALAWSYRLLDAREQIVFRRLSVFAGGWSTEAAAAVCDPHHTLNVDMDTLLTSLVGKSLIYQAASLDGAFRYDMHFVMRAYGADLLEGRRESNSTQQSFASYYANLVEGLEQALTGATQAESLSHLIREYENIRAALQWAREQQAVAIGLKMAGALWWFWENRGYLTEGREWIEGMLEIWHHHPAPVADETIGRAYYGATVLAITQGDSANSQRFAEVCLSYLHASDKRARVLLLLGNMAKAQGTLDEAIRFYSEGLSMLRATNDTKGLLVALNNLSTAYIERGEAQAAMPLLEESLALKRAVGDERGVAVSLMNQGEAFKAQGQYAQALAITHEGLAIFTKLGDMQGQALATNNLGEIAEAIGDDAQAATAFADSLATYRQMEDRPGMAMTLLHLGSVYARQHDLQAAACLREGAILFEEQGNVADMIAATFTLASFDLDVNAPQAALRDLQRVAPLMQGEQPSEITPTLRQRYAELLEQAQAG